MMDIVFATQNAHKLNELAKLMPDTVRLLSLTDIGETKDIPETGHTLEQNASQKAWHIYSKYQVNCFADDTGLEVEALNNEPGVYSARYAGPEKDANNNMAKLLKKLNGVQNRTARFRTIIALIIDGKEIQFEGIVEGLIEHTPMGDKGFGYDPVFVANGHTQTFAQLTLAEKNKISHRAKAVEKLVNFVTLHNNSPLSK